MSRKMAMIKDKERMEPMHEKECGPKKVNGIPTREQEGKWTLPDARFVYQVGIKAAEEIRAASPGDPKSGGESSALK